MVARTRCLASLPRFGFIRFKGEGIIIHPDYKHGIRRQNKRVMQDEGSSRVFGCVAITAALCSFYFGLQGGAGSSLFISLIVWGGIFLVIGILLLLMNRIF